LQGGLFIILQTLSRRGEYQKILDACCENGRFTDAVWLVRKIGKTDDVLEIKEEINDTGLEICFAGTIKFGKMAVLRRLFAGSGIKAGCGIEAGWGIKAGCGIEAGCDHGIYAGLRVRISFKKQYAVITAKEKPKNIVCGEWKERETE